MGGGTKEVRNTFKNVVGKFEGTRDNLEDMEVDGRIILK
jgi:hypothetical protein